MAFVRINPASVARTPGEFAKRLQIAVANHRRMRGRAPLAFPLGRGRGMGSLTPDCAAAQCTGAEVTRWCDSVSAWNPLSYLVCLPQDVQNTYSKLRYGTAFPAPPPAAAPGAPQTYEQMTIPGEYTPDQSAADAAAASESGWAAFFNQVGAGGGGGDSGSGVPAWVWIGVAVLGGAALLGAFKGRGRR